ncbi:TIGR02452 family protein [Paenibacillus sp. KACC 21273]|uniref:TIGR02452 family protein n=1 Tax=Paenibacillus sp. KACC 21273 TaxID=3025665 RepID=UPI00236569EE|nr:TIGR02452 family protein [Paenibacillus sp. KACC 21273]WDF52648.1 TIGR02452 family protein [Paenibacillus sp. KACC 21273]
MTSREIRSKWAQETLDILERGHYKVLSGKQVDIKSEVEYTINNSVLYTPEKLPTVKEKAVAKINTLLQHTNDIKSPYTAESLQPEESSLSDDERCALKIIVNPYSTLKAVEQLTMRQRRDKVACLNFASARNPGGGFLGGSQAQEESLARSSSLYLSQIQMTEMYNYNRQQKSCLYSDYMIYSPQVTVFREDGGSLRAQTYQVSIITAPAVNAGVVREREPEHVDQIGTVMLERIRYILAVAAEQGNEYLVLGAFGCGVFRNDPYEVATWFRQVLLQEKYALLFKQIIFAVYDRSKDQQVIQAFEKIFKA